MLKKIIEKEFGNVSVKELEFAFEGLTLEIKLKRMNYGIRTTLPFLLDKITTYIDFYRRYEKEWDSETNKTKQCA